MTTIYGAGPYGVGPYGLAVAPHGPPLVLPRRTIDQLLTGSHRYVSRVQVWQGGVDTEATVPVVNGKVRVEEGRTPRRTLDLAIAGIPDWIVIGPDDKLHPLSNVELKAQRGVLDDSGVPQWSDLGVFKPLKPAMTHTPDGVGITCSCVDRSEAVKAALAWRRLVMGAGMSVGLAARTVLADRAPWLPVDLPDGDYRLPTAATLAVGADPWEMVAAMYRAVGQELRVDVDGVARAYPITDPLVAPIAADWTTGVHGTITGLDREIDGSAFVNGVLVSWPGGVEVVWDETSPAARSRTGRERLEQVSSDTTTIGDAMQARAVGMAELITRQTAAENIKGTIVADPRRDAGEAVGVHDPTIGVDAVFRIAAIDLPLDGPTMDVQLGARRLT